MGKEGSVKVKKEWKRTERRIKGKRIKGRRKRVWKRLYLEGVAMGAQVRGKGKGVRGRCDCP